MKGRKRSGKRKQASGRGRKSAQKPPAGPLSHKTVSTRTPSPPAAPPVEGTSERRYRDLFTNLKDGVVFSTPDGRILEANDAFLELMGYAREELEELRSEQFYADPEERKRVLQEVNDKGHIQNREVVLRKKDGSVAQCLLTGGACFGPDGSLIGYQSIIRDVSDLFQTQESLRQSEEQARLLLESAPDAIVAVDGAGRITLANDEAERLFGYSPEDLRGQPIEMLLPERFKKAYNEQRAGYRRGSHRARAALPRARAVASRSSPFRARPRLRRDPLR